MSLRISCLGLVILAFILAPAPRPVAADTSDTFTISGPLHMTSISGTVGDDLAAVFANGEDHTWTLTLHGVSRWNTSGSSWKASSLTAESFELVFEGPDADVLNDVVGASLTAGGLGDPTLVNLQNSSSGGTSWGSWWVWLASEDPDTPIAFSAYGEICAPFPTDAGGYPIVGNTPITRDLDQLDITDGRTVAYSSISSWEPGDAVEMVGSVGTAATPVLSIPAAVSVVEGNKGTTKRTVYVSLSSAPSQTVTVSYRTVAGTALVKSDFNALSGTLSFSPGGATQKAITLQIKGERKAEPDETFRLELFNASGASVAAGTTIVTIVNDD